MTTGFVSSIERVDDIPLLLAQMEKIQLAKLLEEQFPVDGNWDGLGLGDIVEVWLAYILSEGDHRLNHVESWVSGLLLTLEKCLGKTVRALDFSDDRLAFILDCLGQDDEFDCVESKLNHTVIRVYDLKITRVRIDSTSVKSYVSVTEDGLFQFGHSKDHRPDLPQLKINQSALDPLGIPLTTTIVSGEKADDPLYIPEINGEIFSWDEQRLVVHSFKYAAKQKKALQVRIEQAEEAIARLNQRGRGVKRLDEKELRSAVDAILKSYAVSGLLQIGYHRETKETHRKAYRQREAYLLVETEITVHTSLNMPVWERTVRCLGWRVYVCNDKELSQGEAVLAYRQEYLIEHGFARYKGKTLGLTPLHLSSTSRIKGLIRLLSIGLRVLCLLEFTVRSALLNNNEKLSGIYKGNPKRATASPTAEMMLKVFRGISLIVITVNGVKNSEITSLTPVQEKILMLLGHSFGCYDRLLTDSRKLIGESEP